MNSKSTVSRIIGSLVPIVAMLAIVVVVDAQERACKRTVNASVVALDQPFMWNRLGAAQPNGMIFALERDVVSIETPLDQNGNDVDPDRYGLEPGKVRLRSGKRPRPIVLRMDVGDCLEISFKNLLNPTVPAPVTFTGSPFQVTTRNAGVRVMGLELEGSINSDGSWAGANPGELGSLARPGETKVYRYFAREEGTFMLYSFDDPSAGQLASGMFGSVNVEPGGAESYRSQVTHEELHLAAFHAQRLPPNMELRQKLVYRDNQLVQQTVVIDGTEYKLWTLITREPDRETVHQVDVVIIDNHLYAYQPEPFGRADHPIINYKALYPPDYPNPRRRCTPILKMHDATYRVTSSGCEAVDAGRNETYHSDLTAVITGPQAGRFLYSTDSPLFNENPASPDRRQPYREFTIFYHVGNTAVQAFQPFYDAALKTTLGQGKDAFAINYGTAGIGAEILANRFGVGPMGRKDAVDLKFEEFFLSSWAVADPAMVVDVPANVQNQVLSDPGNTKYTPGTAKVRTTKLQNELAGTTATSSSPDSGWTPLTGAKATTAYYPDDPSNVYHSYMRDHVKFRVHNAGANSPHVHHQHAHQWLHSPNSDDGHYLDSQMINPGSSYTLEMVYNGSGNRNQTVGDSIFHCHFYPHFAQGMWSLWRVHDVLETGTVLESDGRPAVDARALPDGEIERGTPIPALVPLPTLATAPSPAKVKLTMGGRRAEVIPETTADNKKTYRNPGFPFFIPGVAGHRAPHPPLDFAWEEEPGKPGVAKLDVRTGKAVYLDGGLPRHLILDGKIVREFHTRWDFSKDFVLYNSEDKTAPNRRAVDGGLVAFELPEEGTEVEKAAMAAHAQRSRATFLPSGDPGSFILNGLPPAPGAPYADPAVDDYGNGVYNVRRYQAAVIQIDAVLNKKGWHYPQQRMITLWDDVKPTVSGARPPQPFFFRSNTGEIVEFWHTNLVPDYYEMDDFQVRTPTDILGQHIHLVKFDVTSSDGAGNGFNYEDGTFSTDEVRGRIDAINLASRVSGSICGNNIGNGLFAFDPATQFINCDPSKQRTLTVKPAPAMFGPAPPGQNWAGAQTTIQRFDSDPLLNNKGEDRTVRTVFTHDHFGPSTHQQIGLYAGMLVEPENSRWELPDGTPMYTRPDGGPTSWQANIITANPEDSYREFALEFQDLQLAYTRESRASAGRPAIQLFTMAQSLAGQLDTGQVTESVRTQYSSNGRTLSVDAKRVDVVVAGREWRITDPRTLLEYSIVNQTQANPPALSVRGMPGLFTTTVGSVPNNAGPVPDGLKQTFAQNGITLSDTSRVEPLVKSKLWLIVDSSTPDEEEVYPILAPSSGTSAQVCTPQITPGWADPQFAINQPSPPSGTPPPSPWIISSGQGGTFSLNYRNEPVPYRVSLGVPDGPGPDDPVKATDLSFAFSSIKRFDNDLNQQPAPGQPIDPAKPDGFKFPANLVPTVNGRGQPCFDPNQPGKAQPCDPFTPLLRAYENDKVQIRTLVGAHFLTHSFMLHGPKWLYEPSYTNSGFKNTLGMGLSEHFEMLFTVPSVATAEKPFSDYWYAPSSNVTGLTNGLWGIMRSYDGSKGLFADLKALPNNPKGTAARKIDFRPPAGVTPREFTVLATTAQQAFGAQGLVYNSRGQAQAVANQPPFNTTQPIQNPYALLYINAEDIDPSSCNLDPASPNFNPQNCKPKTGYQSQPLVLRAAAGDWIKVNLVNGFNPAPIFTSPATPADVNTLNGGKVPTSLGQAFGGYLVVKVTGATVSTTVAGCGWTLTTSKQDTTVELQFSIQLTTTLEKGALFNVFPLNSASEGNWNWKASPFAQVTGASSPFGKSPLPSVCLLTSPQVGLHAQLVDYDVNRADGTNVGFNPIQTVEPGKSQTIFWYAGSISVNADGTVERTPVELGAINLTASDPMVQPVNALLGALIIEPRGSSWCEDTYSGSGNVPLKRRASASVFTEQVRDCGGQRPQPAFREFVAMLHSTNTKLFKGTTAITNTGGYNYRTEPMSYRYPSAIPPGAPNGMSEEFTNQLVGQDPQTPVFSATKGTPVRFRMLYSDGGGGGTAQVVMIHGHGWQEEPFVDGSTVIGNNRMSQWLGAQQMTQFEQYNMVLPSAGGKFQVPGDYLFHPFLGESAGMWGIFRVSDGADAAVINSASLDSSTNLAVSGVNTVNSRSGRYARTVKIYQVTAQGDKELGTTNVNGADGTWTFSLSNSQLKPGDRIRTDSTDGGDGRSRVVSIPFPIDAVVINSATVSSTQLTVTGQNTLYPGSFSNTVTIYQITQSGPKSLGTATLSSDGTWTFGPKGVGVRAGDQVFAQSSGGGKSQTATVK